VGLFTFSPPFACQKAVIVTVPSPFPSLIQMRGYELAKFEKEIQKKQKSPRSCDNLVEL